MEYPAVIKMNTLKKQNVKTEKLINPLANYPLLDNR